jgi:hypothetical protein
VKGDGRLSGGLFSLQRRNNAALSLFERQVRLILPGPGVSSPATSSCSRGASFWARGRLRAALFVWSAEQVGVNGRTVEKIAAFEGGGEERAPASVSCWRRSQFGRTVGCRERGCSTGCSSRPFPAGHLPPERTRTSPRGHSARGFFLSEKRLTLKAYSSSPHSRAR